jgi:hypothetical protein
MILHSNERQSLPFSTDSVPEALACSLASSRSGACLE